MEFEYCRLFVSTQTLKCRAQTNCAAPKSSYTSSDVIIFVCLNFRRRLVLTIRPLLEAYAATCRCLVDGSQKEVLRITLDSLIEDYTQNRMPYG